MQLSDIGAGGEDLAAGTGCYQSARAARISADFSETRVHRARQRTAGGGTGQRYESAAVTNFEKAFLGRPPKP
jgi:hypothetical protein